MFQDKIVFYYVLNVCFYCFRSEGDDHGGALRNEDEDLSLEERSEERENRENEALEREEAARALQEAIDDGEAGAAQDAAAAAEAAARLDDNIAELEAGQLEGEELARVHADAEAEVAALEERRAERARRIAKAVTLCDRLEAGWRAERGDQ